MPQETYDASDPEQVNIARIKAGKRKSQKVEVIRALMSQKACRVWLYELLSLCQVFGETLVAGAPDVTAWNQGKRSVGVQLLGDIMDASPNEFMLMCKEGKEYLEENYES